MNHQRSAGSSFLVYTAAILGAFLIMFFLVRAMKHYTSPPPIDQQRAEDRRKALTDLRAASASALSSYSILDPGKKIVRLPIDRAMELMVQEWQNPAAARSNLIARMEVATAPPPAPPEKPNEYE